MTEKTNIIDRYPLLASCSSSDSSLKIIQFATQNSSQQSLPLLIRYLYLVTIQRGLASCQREQRSQFVKCLLESDHKLIDWLKKNSSIKQSMTEAIDRSLLALKLDK